MVIYLWMRFKELDRFIASILLFLVMNLFDIFIASGRYWIQFDSSEGVDMSF